MEVDESPGDGGQEKETKGSDLLGFRDVCVWTPRIFLRCPPSHSQGMAWNKFRVFQFKKQAKQQQSSSWNAEAENMLEVWKVSLDLKGDDIRNVGIFSFGPSGL